MNIIEYSNARSEQVDTLLQHIADGELTVDEAAQSLSGWELKNHPHPERFGDFQLNSNRMEFDSRRPGFSGIVPSRHL
jgi:hypothetical protein